MKPVNPLFNFKIKKLFIVIFVLVFLVMIANCGICSDNTTAGSQQSAIPAPSVQPQQYPVAPQQQVTEQIPQEQVSPEQQQTAPSPIVPPDTNQGFMGNFMNMLSVLLKVIVFILVIASIIVLLRRLKLKLPASKPRSPSKKKNGGTEEGIDNFEPANVSEAVSSFVRHKIRR